MAAGARPLATALEFLAPIAAVPLAEASPGAFSVGAREVCSVVPRAGCSGSDGRRCLRLDRLPGRGGGGESEGRTVFQAPRTSSGTGGGVLTVDMLEMESLARGIPPQLLFLVIFQGDSPADRRSQVIWVQASTPLPTETCAPEPGLASSERSGLLDLETGPAQSCAVSASWQRARRETERIADVRAATLYGGGIRVDRCRLGETPGGGLAGGEPPPALSCVESTWLPAPHAREDGGGGEGASAHCCFAWTHAQDSVRPLGLAASWGRSVVLYELFEGTWSVRKEVVPPEGLHRPVLRLAAWHSEGGSPGGADLPEGGFVATFASEMTMRETSPVFLETSRDTTASGAPDSATEGEEKGLGEELLSDEGMTMIGQKTQVAAAAVPSMFILGELDLGTDARGVCAACSLLHRPGRGSSGNADLALELDFLPHPDIAVSRGGFLYLSSTLGPPQVGLVALCQHGERSTAGSGPSAKAMQGRSLQVLKKFSLGNILSRAGLSEPAPQVRVRALEVLSPVGSAPGDRANFVVQFEENEPPASGRFFSAQVASSSVSQVFCASFEFQPPSRGRETPNRDSQSYALERILVSRMDALERTLRGALSDLSSTVCKRLDALEAKVAAASRAPPRS